MRLLQYLVIKYKLKKNEMNKDNIINMAKEAGFTDADAKGIWITDGYWDEELRRFADLVAAAKRNKLAAWMMQRGYATGHGDSIEDMLQELDWQIRERESQNDWKPAPDLA